jgi:hypothetical protein
MFFVRGLSSKGKEVFINPDQVLYVSPTGWQRKGTVLVMTHRKRLVVDQDPHTVRQRFEDYLNEIVTADDPAADDDDIEETGHGGRFDRCTS